MRKNNRKDGISFYTKESIITPSLIKNYLMFAFWIVMAIALAYFLVFFFGIKTVMLGNSMEGALHNGQELFIDRVVYSFTSPKEGDIVIFYPNGNEKSRYYIKRVIGVPGDKIIIKDGVFYKNDEPVMDYFNSSIKDPGIAQVQIKLDEDEYFLMGDNVNNSEDSRSANIGAVNINAIKGKLWLHMASEDEGVGLVK